MTIYPDILKEFNNRTKNKVVVTGTNGKTTTNNIIYHILKNNNSKVVSNLKGANMKQGVITAFLRSPYKYFDWASLEVDEGSIANVSQDFDFDYIIINNFFKDQLDRYFETDILAKNVYNSLDDKYKQNKYFKLILNGDDPIVAQFQSLKSENVFFGIEDDNIVEDDSYNLNRSTEMVNCPICSKKLNYNKINYGSLGEYSCSCGYKRPELDYWISDIKNKGDYCTFTFNTKYESYENVKFNYPILFNIYNCCAAMAFAFEAGLKPKKIIKSVKKFKYELGRMEKFTRNNQDFYLFLSKNPVGLSEILKNLTFNDKSKVLIFDLNDKPADGADVSWIWDAKLEFLNKIPNIQRIYSTGKRSYDMSIRIRYTNFDVQKIENDDNMLNILEKCSKFYPESDVYVISSYTALYENQKFLKQFSEEMETNND